MKLIYMGTPDFAVLPLEALLAAGHEIKAVVCQPDKPKGRHGILTPPPVKEAAEKAGIPVLQPMRVRDENFLDAIRAFEPEVIVVAAYGKILPKELLLLPKYGCINIHASLLPRWRGAAPIQWAVIAGDKEAGISIMQMDEGLDTGDVLLTESIALSPEETGGSLFERLAALGGPLIVKTLELLSEGKLHPVPQPETGVCYAPKLEKKTGDIAWEKRAAEIERLVRGLSPWPGAYSHLGGKLLKIHAAALPSEEEISAAKPFSSIEKQENTALQQGIESLQNVQALPGTLFCSPDKEKLYVMCGDALLSLKSVQLEGKRRMEAAEFIRGAERLLLSGEKLQQA